jgi:hypothetical protein
MPEISIKAKLQEIADAQINCRADNLAANAGPGADTYNLTTNHYIADHIHRIERAHVGHPNLIADSKWRIASALGVFKEELADDGSLTPEQIQVIDAYIAKFKATPAGHEAIAEFEGQR